MPLVCVIIPAHRAAGYLAAAVHSVYRQSVDVEVVIVVDGDGDNGATAKAAAALAQERRTTRVLEVPQGGVSAARTAGMRASSEGAPYVLFLDADDALIPGRLSAMVAALESAGPACPAVVGSAVIVGEDGHPIAPEGWEHLPDGWLTLPGAISGTLALPSMTLWRRAALRLLMPWPASITGEDGADLRCEDALLVRRALRLGALRTTSTPTTFYRRHPGQWSADLRRREGARRMGSEIDHQSAEWAQGYLSKPADGLRIVDPLYRTRCGVDESVEGEVVITCASAGWEFYLEAMLHSLRNAGQWEGPVVVYRLGDASYVDAVAKSFGATILPAEPLAPLGPWSKSVLYTAARSLPIAESFLAIDADCLIHRPIADFFMTGDDESIWMARDGNGIHPPERSHGANLWRYAAGFAGMPDDFCRALGLHGAAGEGPPTNDGVFAASENALFYAEKAARQLFFASWPHLEAGGTWWNQIVWNAACAPQLRLLPDKCNVQRHAFAATGKPLPEVVTIEHFTAGTKPLMLGETAGPASYGTGCAPVAGFAGLKRGA